MKVYKVLAKDGREMNGNVFSQKCAFCKRTIAANANGRLDFEQFIQSQGWVFRMVNGRPGWYCPEHAGDESK